MSKFISLAAVSSLLSPSVFCFFVAFSFCFFVIAPLSPSVFVLLRRFLLLFVLLRRSLSLFFVAPLSPPNVFFVAPLSPPAVFFVAPLSPSVFLLRRCFFFSIPNHHHQDGEIDWDRLEELRTAVGKDR